jgi:cytochrome c556
MKPPPYHGPLEAKVALAVWLGLSISSGAQAPVQAPAPAPAPKPLVPAAASTLAKSPEPFYGEVVSVTAAVERAFSPSAFSIDQDRTKSTGQDLLVLAPTLTAVVNPNTYVTVVGEVVRFDPAEIVRRAKNYTLDLGPEIIAKYQGRPAILATAVVNTAMVDLARRVPPPMTPEEEAYDKVMKRVGPAFNNLRTALTASDAAAAAENTKVLKAAFAEAEAFWKARATADALEWTRSARKHVDALERAVGAGNWDLIKTSAGDLGQVCQTCHNTYRERLDDGTFRIRSR